MSGSDKSKDKLHAGCGGVAPATRDDPPRIAPGLEEPPTDDFGEEQRDLSTNKVGDPIYEFPPEDGRDTWGWENSPIDSTLLAVYFMINGASLPSDLHQQLVEFVESQGEKLTEEQRRKISRAVNIIKSQPTEDP